MASCCGKLSALWSRRKPIGADMMKTDLDRCLTTFDLTLLGVGHMVGSGVYVATGTVVATMAGPGTWVSYLIAGIAAAISALCYAEFGARIPRAGSAYSYTYTTVGEPLAFIVGWNMILEFCLCCASITRSLSGTIDTLSGNAISNWSINTLGVVTFGGIEETYPDLLGLLLVIIVMFLIATGAKISLGFNNIFTIINIGFILLIIIAGFIYADPANWSLRGGYFPFGAQGVVTGAATCFFSFMGFEGIAVAGEETKNPSRSIPIATITSMSCVAVLYALAAVVLSLLVPWYDVYIPAPFPEAFAAQGIGWAFYTVAVGSIIGMFTCIIANAFGIPRQIYAMANDGLLFSFLAWIEPRTKSPVAAILASIPITGTLVVLLDITTLVEFLSIGTLFSYTVVCVCLLLLRYKSAQDCPFKLQGEGDADGDADGDTTLMIKNSQKPENIGQLKPQFKDMRGLSTADSGNVTVAVIVCLTASILILSGALALIINRLPDVSWWLYIWLATSTTLTAILFTVLCLYEPNRSFKTYQVPWVPLLPTVGIIFNLFLMTQVNYLSWIRLFCWLAVGLLIYLLYGMGHSKENQSIVSQGDTKNYNSVQDTDQ